MNNFPLVQLVFNVNQVLLIRQLVSKLSVVENHSTIFLGVNTLVRVADVRPQFEFIFLQLEVSFTSNSFEYGMLNELRLSIVGHCTVLLFNRFDYLQEVEAGPASALDVHLVVGVRTASLVPYLYNIN
jgi:hypothetical protein